MGLNETVSAERVQIGFFGKRNAGKSSVVNAVAGQEVALVSDTLGTTTDPVRKAMELLPLGPVVLIDTAGFDDVGELGLQRVGKTNRVMQQVDVAVIVADAGDGELSCELELIQKLVQRKVPCIAVFNKSDLAQPFVPDKLKELQGDCGEELLRILTVSALTGAGINELKECLAELGKQCERTQRLVADLLEEGDHVILVVPIDESAPKGRLILPQQQTIRDILDASAFCSVVKPSGLRALLDGMKEFPRLVITDSQAFGEVSRMVPQEIPLTSFSILMARYKGNLYPSVNGANVLDDIHGGDRILISEGCTHHRQCGDIGTVKLPNLIRKYSGCEPAFSFSSGNDFPEDVSGYRLVIHCGACTLNEKEMQRRAGICQTQGVPMTNFGIAIAKMNGILERSIAPLRMDER